MQAYWLVVRVLLTPPAEAAASQKWKIIYLQVLMFHSYIWQKSPLELADRKEEDTGSIVSLMEND